MSAPLHLQLFLSKSGTLHFTPRFLEEPDLLVLPAFENHLTKYNVDCTELKLCNTGAYIIS